MERTTIMWTEYSDADKISIDLPSRRQMHAGKIQVTEMIEFDFCYIRTELLRSRSSSDTPLPSKKRKKWIIFNSVVHVSNKILFLHNISLWSTDPTIKK